MPAEFVGSDFVVMPISRVEDGLRSFVRETIDRLQHSNNTCVESLHENWTAICETDEEEVQFCRAAGRLGLDPYSNEISTTVQEFLESGMSGFLEQPLGIDFLESSPEHASLSNNWKSIEATLSEQQMSASPQTRVSLDINAANPWTAGYALARRLRADLPSKNVAGPLFNVNDVALAVDVEPAVIVDAKVPCQAVVGWNKSKPIIAGMPPRRGDNQRFWQARSLYHLLYSCHESPRLCTSSRTWDQKASRAFAAELLAPKAEIVAIWDSRQPDADQIENVIKEIADLYKVSARVVESQLKNANIDFLSC